MAEEYSADMEDEEYSAENEEEYSEAYTEEEYTEEEYTDEYSEEDSEADIDEEDIEEADIVQFGLVDEEAYSIVASYPDIRIRLTTDGGEIIT